MRRIIIGIISIVMFSLNIYLYIWDPLEKHCDLIKITFGWLLLFCTLNYLFRHNKAYEELGYIINLALLLLAYWVIPM